MIFGETVHGEDELDIQLTRALGLVATGCLLTDRGCPAGRGLEVSSSLSLLDWYSFHEDVYDVHHERTIERRTLQTFDDSSHDEQSADMAAFNRGPLMSIEGRRSVMSKLLQSPRFYPVRSSSFPPVFRSFRPSIVRRAA